MNYKLNVFGIPEPEYHKKEFHKQNQMQKEKIYPSIHFSEYKDNSPKPIHKVEQKLNKFQEMEMRTKNMISSLRGNEQSGQLKEE